jgi:hypothetical protein
VELGLELRAEEILEEHGIAVAQGHGLLELLRGTGRVALQHRDLPQQLVEGRVVLEVRQARLDERARVSETPLRDERLRGRDQVVGIG